MYSIIGNRPENLLLSEINKKEAYDALPEPYKNDSCLLFYMNEDGSELFAENDLGETYTYLMPYKTIAWGNWVRDDDSPVFPDYWS